MIFQLTSETFISIVTTNDLLLVDLKMNMMNTKYPLQYHSQSVKKSHVSDIIPCWLHVAKNPELGVKEADLCLMISVLRIFVHAINTSRFRNITVHHSWRLGKIISIDHVFIRDWLSNTISTLRCSNQAKIVG